MAKKTTSRKMKAYGSFAEWKQDQSARNQRLIGALQRLIKKTAPHLETTVKWGQGAWVAAGAPKVYIHAEPDHVQLGFYAGSSLRDPKGLLVGKGRFVRHVKVRSARDIDEAAFVAWILQATK